MLMILIQLTWSCAGVHALGKIKPLSSLWKSKGSKKIKRKAPQVKTGIPVGLFSVTSISGSLLC